MPNCSLVLTSYTKKDRQLLCVTVIFPNQVVLQGILPSRPPLSSVALTQVSAGRPG